jgi:hypothetical protein
MSPRAGLDVVEKRSLAPAGNRTAIPWSILVSVPVVMRNQVVINILTVSSLGKPHGRACVR